MRDLLFTACVGEVDATLLYAIEDRADQVGKTQRRRHVGIQLVGNPPEVIDVLSGEGDRFQLVRRRRSFLNWWYEVHSRQLQFRSDWEDQIPTPKLKKFLGRDMRKQFNPFAGTSTASTIDPARTSRQRPASSFTIGCSTSLP